MNKLFNQYGKDKIENIKMIYGEPTGIFNLNTKKYQWSGNLYRYMTGNFWLPEKVSLVEDKNQYSTLTEEEKTSYKGIVSFLTFLDSIQTNNLPHIADYITAPEVKLLLAIQTYQEAIHSQSYAVLIESIIPSNERDNIYYFWKNNKILLDRNNYIVRFYEDYINSPTPVTFSKVIIANYILEGLYFYNGFAFFYNLAKQSKMLGTADMIKYINRDELSHCVLFRNIITELFKENQDLKSLIDESIYQMFEEAVIQEINWSNFIIPNNETKNENYTKWLADERLKQLGYKTLYNVNNPYPDLEAMGNLKNDVKANFFEATVTSYNQVTNVEGWDDL